MSHIINSQYNDLGKSEIINQREFNIIPTGFTTNCTLAIVNNTTVTVSTFTAYIKDSVQNLAVRIENDATENTSISSSAPYLVVRLTWTNAVSNDFTYMNVAYGDILTTDLIIGKGVYSGVTLTSFDYSDQSINILKDNGANITTIAYETNSDPTANNDDVDTASIGKKFYRDDKWLNTTTKMIFKCVDNTTGTAIWYQITSNQALSTTDSVTFAGLTLNGNEIIRSGNELRINETDNTHYVGFKAPTLSANQIWTLPTADGTANQLLGTDGSGNLSFFTSGSTVFPFLSTTGLIMSNNSSDLTNDIDFTAGSTVDSTNAYIITVGALTKQLDATFTAGTNQGMLDIGSKANSTVYYIYAIGKTTDSNAGDILASTSSTSPTMPSGWDIKKLIRVIKTDSVGVVHIVENRNDQDTGLKMGQPPTTSVGYARDANYLYFFQVQAAQNTIVNTLKTYIRGTTNGAKMVFGIYTDTAGVPDTLLSQSQELTIVSASDNDKFLLPTLRSNLIVTKGNNYWICFIQNQAATFYDTVGYPSKYLAKAQAYNATLPATIGGGTGAASYNIAFEVF
jgi:hypothetical protein